VLPPSSGRWKQHGPPTTALHGVTSQKTKSYIFTTVETSNINLRGLALNRVEEGGGSWTSSPENFPMILKWARKTQGKKTVPITEVIWFTVCTIYSDWLRAGRSGFDSRRRMGIFLFDTISRPALRSTQPPIQWVPGPPSLGLKRPGREADHSPPSSAEVK
jgi:hypothetical protein